MSNENVVDDYDPDEMDQTVDPADPEPRFKDIDNQTDEEAAVHMAWLKRNIEAIGKRGVECYIDPDYDDPLPGEQRPAPPAAS